MRRRIATLGCSVDTVPASWRGEYSRRREFCQSAPPQAVDQEIGGEPRIVPAEARGAAPAPEQRLDQRARGGEELAQADHREIDEARFHRADLPRLDPGGHRRLDG